MVLKGENEMEFEKVWEIVQKYEKLNETLIEEYDKVCLRMRENEGNLYYLELGNAYKSGLNYALDLIEEIEGEQK